MSKVKHIELGFSKKYGFYQIYIVRRKSSPILANVHRPVNWHVALEHALALARQYKCGIKITKNVVQT